MSLSDAYAAIALAVVQLAILCFALGALAHWVWSRW